MGTITNPMQAVGFIKDILRRYEGQRINRNLAIQVARVLVPALPRETDRLVAFDEMVDSLTVRRNMVLTESLIAERANNIAAAWPEYGRGD